MGKTWIDDLSHELRAPLANLSARLEAMEEGLWPADSIHLRGCRDDVKRLVRLVERMEAVARAESLEPLQLTSIRLDHIVARVCSSHAANFQSRGVTLSWDGDPVGIRADESSLSTVLSELLANAVQATPQGGRVEVLAKALLVDGHPQVEIRVADSGRGIAAQALPHLFEKFFRVDPSRSSLTGGAGLGLILCDSLIRQHGGTIVVD